MDFDLDAILDTPVQTSLFVDCFDDLMDSLAGDFPLNGEFDSILDDLHQSTTTVLTPEPSPLPEDHANATVNGSTGTQPEESEIILQTELLSTTNDDGSVGMTVPSSSTLDQFDAMMCLSGASPPSEFYRPFQLENQEILTDIHPLDIVDPCSVSSDISVQQAEASTPQNHSKADSVTQQTLLVQAEGQQFEIAISFSVPPDETAKPPAQQPVTTQPQRQWTVAAQPTASIRAVHQKQIQPTVIQQKAVRQDAGKVGQANTLKQPTVENFHDNYQSWLYRKTRYEHVDNIIRPRTSQFPTDHIVVEDQSTTANPKPTDNFVHVPSSYVINANGTHKTFVVHEVYKVAHPVEFLEEQPNRKRPRKSNVVYDTDFLCVPCQKTFGKKGSLKQHIRSYHSEPLPWHCTTCGKKFATEQQLQRHVVNHDQRNKKFQCSECDKRYVHSKDRDRHFLTHHGVPAHACGQCSMAFARRDHLLAHEMTHEKRQGREVRIQVVARQDKGGEE